MELVFWAGLALFVLGGLGMLLAAFKTGVLWGLALIFLAPAVFVFLFLHWDSAKGPFKLQLTGLLIMVAGAYFGQGPVLSPAI